MLARASPGRRRRFSKHPLERGPDQPAELLAPGASRFPFQSSTSSRLRTPACAGASRHMTSAHGQVEPDDRLGALEDERRRDRVVRCRRQTQPSPVGRGARRARCNASAARLPVRAVVERVDLDVRDAERRGEPSARGVVLPLPLGPMTASARQSRNSPRATTTAEPPTSTSVRRARDRVERRRPPDLDALVDLDLVAELDPAVPGEVERERPRGRAGRRILGNAVRGDEDARLPALAVAREAARCRTGLSSSSAPKSGRSAATASGEPSSTSDVPRALGGRARPAARLSRRRARRAARRRASYGSCENGGCGIQPKTIREPSRSSRTGTTPAPVSSRSRRAAAARASTNAVPSIGCPANGSSSAGVKIRIRTCPSAGRADRRRPSRERFISRASGCSCSSGISRASVKTASWLPASGTSVKTSATT